MVIHEFLGRYVTGKFSLRPIEWRGVLTGIPVFSLVGGIIIVVLEPDHSEGLGLVAAVGLWSFHLLFLLLLFVGCLELAQQAGLWEPIPIVAAILLLPWIFAPVSLLLDYGFGKPDEELTSGAGVSGAYLSEVFAVAPVSTVAALIMACFLYRQASVRPTPDDGLKDTLPQEPPALVDLIPSLPAGLGGDIIRMHAQDHYVEVVTAAGRGMVLERFGDCVSRLETLDGMQCHRSHWIGLRHVKELRRSGSAYVCELGNGDQVPVSRRRYTALKRLLESHA